MSKPTQQLLLQVPESPRLILAPVRLAKSTAAQQTKQPEVPVRLYLTVKR